MFIKISFLSTSLRIIIYVDNVNNSVTYSTLTLFTNYNNFIHWGNKTTNITALVTLTVHFVNNLDIVKKNSRTTTTTTTTSSSNVTNVNPVGHPSSMSWWPASNECAGVLPTPDSM